MMALSRVGCRHSPTVSPPPYLFNIKRVEHVIQKRTLLTLSFLDSPINPITDLLIIGFGFSHFRIWFGKYDCMGCVKLSTVLLKGCIDDVSLISNLSELVYDSGPESILAAVVRGKLG